MAALMLLTLAGPPALVVLLVAIDLVRRPEPVSPVWLAPALLSVLGLWGWTAFLIDPGYGSAPTYLVPQHAALFASAVSWTWLASALGLATSRGLAPGPRDADPPMLRAPTPVEAGLGLLGVLTLLPTWFVASASVWSLSALVAAGLPWWLAFGRESGSARVDEARRVTAGMLFGAGFAWLCSALAARGMDRAPLDVEDFVLVGLAAGVTALPLVVGRPAVAHLAAGALAVALPTVGARLMSLPSAPIEVPRLVTLDGTPVALREPLCVERNPGVEVCDIPLVDVFHPFGACMELVDGTERTIAFPPDHPPGWKGSPDCMLAITPETSLRALGHGIVGALLVENGRFALSGTDLDQTLLIERDPRGARLSTHDEPVAMDALPAVLAEVGARVGRGNSVRIWGPDWTLQSAIAICGTAYEAGFDHCTLIGGDQHPLISGPQLLSPFELANPGAQLDTADPRGGR
jgi:hypothetical protein